MFRIFLWFWLQITVTPYHLHYLSNGPSISRTLWQCGYGWIASAGSFPLRDDESRKGENGRQASVWVCSSTKAHLSGKDDGLVSVRPLLERVENVENSMGKTPKRTSNPTCMWKCSACAMRSPWWSRCSKMCWVTTSAVSNSPTARRQSNDIPDWLASRNGQSPRRARSP